MKSYQWGVSQAYIYKNGLLTGFRYMGHGWDIRAYSRNTPYHCRLCARFWVICTLCDGGYRNLEPEPLKKYDQIFEPSSQTGIVWRIAYLKRELALITSVIQRQTKIRMETVPGTIRSVWAWPDKISTIGMEDKTVWTKYKILTLDIKSINLSMIIIWNFRM